MKQLKLKVKTREEKGRRQVNRLRRSGFIPGVIYGKSGSHALSINEKELKQLLNQMRGATALIEAEDESGKKHLSVIQEIKRDSITDKLVHIDFHEISANEKMKATIPVHLVGESYGVKNESGVLQFLNHSVEVRCLPKYLPEYINVDISELRLNESIHIKDLPVLEGVEYLGEDENVVVACSEPTKEEEPKDETEGAVEGEGAAADAGKAADSSKGNE